jgi:hypothetical protein
MVSRSGIGQLSRLRELGFLHGPDQGDDALELVEINDLVAAAIRVDRSPRDCAERRVTGRAIRGKIAEGSICE